MAPRPRAAWQVDGRVLTRDGDGFAGVSPGLPSSPQPGTPGVFAGLPRSTWWGSWMGSLPTIPQDFSLLPHNGLWQLLRAPLCPCHSHCGAPLRVGPGWAGLPNPISRVCGGSLPCNLSAPRGLRRGAVVLCSCSSPRACGLGPERSALRPVLRLLDLRRFPSYFPSAYRFLSYVSFGFGLFPASYLRTNGALSPGCAAHPALLLGGGLRGRQAGALK